MRTARAIIALMLLSTLGFGAANSNNAHPYRREWKQKTVGKGAAAHVVLGAGVGQLRNSPKKYGRGVTGFGKRVGAGFATNAVSQTVEHGVAAKLHEDLHYHPSNKKGIAPRLGYALK